MDEAHLIFKELEKCGFRVSTDTRKDVSNSVYFAIKGENFDGNKFVHEALGKGTVAAVTDNPGNAGEKVCVVQNVLETLQKVANMYRKAFDMPTIVIGGSNGKTTSKELIRKVLETKFKLHATTENLNNHIGVPLSILSMNKNSEIGLFEIGANHRGEHSKLLEILEPTIVIVTNNGLDHLEGFGSPEGVRLANKEIYDWARLNSATAFVNKNHPDLMEDSECLERIIYPEENFEIIEQIPLTFKFRGDKYTTNLAGEYNIENICLALSVGEYFKIDLKTGLEAICQYQPSLKRSQFVKIGSNSIILDCYNANPSSMQLALESFIGSTKKPRGVILGDMLELGTYAESEHKKIVEYVRKQEFDCMVFIGENFKAALRGEDFNHQWFPSSDKAREWFAGQNFDSWTFLLKGSRGIKVERVLGDMV